MAHSKKTPYRVSGPLVLSGALSKMSESKCLHALFVLAQGQGWEADSRGMYRIRLGELHRLTGKTHRKWHQYLDTLTRIRDNVRLDWGHLSRKVGGFNRTGDTPLVTEVFAELDLAGGFEEIAFALPSSLVEDVIKPHWFGQVDTGVLFSLRSNYAFNAYLYASLTVIEKDKTKSEFFSHAYPIDEWREILGSGDAYPAPAHFRAKVFKRTEASILKARDVDGFYLSVKWIETKMGLYQMHVKRLRKLPSAKSAPKPVTAAEKASAAELKANGEYFAKLRKSTGFDSSGLAPQ